MLGPIANNKVDFDGFCDNSNDFDGPDKGSDIVGNINTPEISVDDTRDQAMPLNVDDTRDQAMPLNVDDTRDQAMPLNVDDTRDQAMPLSMDDIRDQDVPLSMDDINSIAREVSDQDGIRDEVIRDAISDYRERQIAERNIDRSERDSQRSMVHDQNKLIQSSGYHTRAGRGRRNRY